MIRIVLADDQALVRHGLRALLALTGEIDIVGEAEDGAAAVALIREVRPDLALVDVRMPVLDGPAVVAELSRNGGLVPIILLTTFDDDDALIEGISHGAAGFLLKGIEPDRLMENIRTVAAGGICGYDGGTDRLRRALVDRARNIEGLEPADPLTDRETDVLRLMSAGLGNREIGRSLNISEGTAKNHVSMILSKLGVDDRVKAVLKAIRDGVI